MTKKVHFVGVGGIGVSALARHYLAHGWMVTGSDENLCEDLKKEGITVFKGHSEQNISRDVKKVIYSPAVSPDNPELKKATEMEKELRSYPEALGEMTENYFTVAVSGTHGKSTTTGMVSLVMIRGGLDPTVIIGTKMNEFGGTNYRKGSSKYLVIEADEYKASFLNYSPQIAIITNIEEDHLDYYRDLNHILSTFREYMRNNVKRTLIINMDDKGCKKIKKAVMDKEIIEYSLKESLVKEIELSIPGKHNLQNALGAYKAGERLGIEKKDVLQGLKEFRGTWRRFDEEEVYLQNGKKIKLINDYAHHPTAVEVTLEAVKEKYPQEKIIAVFQPHQYERTHRLFSYFRKVLAGADVYRLLVTDIYTVKGRESEEVLQKVNSKMLAENLEKVEYTGDLEKTAETLLKNLHGGEILIIMGAGDVYNLGGYIKKV